MNHAEKCPVCLGNGLVPNGFYSTTHHPEFGGLAWSSAVNDDTDPEQCRSCEGKGWIEVDDKAIRE